MTEFVQIQLGRMMLWWGELRRDRRGAGIGEYILILGFVAVMLIGTVVAFRGEIQGAFTRMGNDLRNFR